RIAGCETGSARSCRPRGRWERPTTGGGSTVCAREFDQSSQVTPAAECRAGPRRATSRVDNGGVEARPPGEGMDFNAAHMLGHYAELGEEIRDDNRAALDHNALDRVIGFGALVLVERGARQLDQPVDLVVAEMRFVPLRARFQVEFQEGLRGRAVAPRRDR